MKPVLLICVTILGLISCVKNPDIVITENSPDAKQSTQKWQLVKTSGQIQGSERTGSDMEWQEFYLLNSDDTFVKSRTTKGTTFTASGTYKFTSLSDGKYLDLAYKTDHEIIGNCTEKQEELLFFSSENTLQGTWWACDGPGLFYQKVE